MSISTRRRQRTLSGSPDIFDGRFTVLGTYAAASGMFSGRAPAPWRAAEYATSPESHIVVYDAASKPDPSWPDPYLPWATTAGAFVSYFDGVAPNARAQCHGSPTWRFHEGSEFYLSFVCYVPDSIGVWPQRSGPTDDWNVLFQFHTPPYNGSPAVCASLRWVSGVLEIFGTNKSGAAVWSHPISTNRWVKVTLHTIMSTQAGDGGGLLEAWVDGVRQTMTLPRTGQNYNTAGQYISADGYTAYIATEVADADLVTGGDPYLNCYRRGAGGTQPAGEITVFHAGMKVGSTYESVQ